MARNISTVYTVTGHLVAQTPIHIGGIDGGNPDSDMPLAVDGRGRYYIPGTSLAGALRQWTEAQLGASVVKSLWGFQESDEGVASLFTIEDGIIVAAMPPEVRDGVGINKKTGTAQHRIKYDTTILPRGTEMDFRCSLASINGQDGEDGTGALRMLLEALQHGSIRLGAQRTRGMGKVALKDCQVKCAVLDTRQGIIDHLEGHDKAVDIQSLPAARGSDGHRIEVTIDWHPTEPLMVKSGTDGIAVDALPLVSAVDSSHVTLVMPGSSIKGVLSSRANLIVATVTGHNPDDEVSKVNTVLSLLFGTSRAEASEKDTVKGMGMLAVDDCYAKVSIDRANWEELATALNDETVRTVLERARLEDKLQEAYHVAIDRWTGGASNQKLFNQMKPQGLAWEPIVLSLDFSRLQERPKQQAMIEEQKQMAALLLLVLRDMSNGRLPFGFGTNRGMGSVAVDRIVLTPFGVSWMKEGAELDKGDIEALPDALIKDLEQAWQSLIANHGGA
jgi:CRISPR/Cas system CSM-associated protein Csm3 (group 7 of RAMP superfamily)